MAEPGAVRWTISVSRETDAALRAYLTQEGLRKSDLSRFVAEAARWRLFDLNVSAARAGNMDRRSEDIDDTVEKALANVRAERFKKPA